MSDLRPDNGNDPPQDDRGRGLSGLPPEWGTIVIPDDPSELAGEADQIRRELAGDPAAPRPAQIATGLTIGDRDPPRDHGYGPLHHDGQPARGDLGQPAAGPAAVQPAPGQRRRGSDRPGRPGPADAAGRTGLRHDRRRPGPAGRRAAGGGAARRRLRLRSAGLGRGGGGAARRACARGGHHGATGGRDGQQRTRGLSRPVTGDRRAGPVVGRVEGGTVADPAGTLRARYFAKAAPTGGAARALVVNRSAKVVATIPGPPRSPTSPCRWGDSSPRRGGGVGVTVRRAAARLARWPVPTPLVAQRPRHLGLAP